MKRLVVLALVLGCGEEAGEMYPIHPGGGGGAGGTFRNDGGMDAGDDGGGPISGRVCLLASSLRSVASTCATTGAQDLTVALGTETATTSADGSFTIPRPTATDLYWIITGEGIVGSLVKFGSTFGAGSTTLLPAFDTDAYDDMIANNSIAAGASGMIVRVTNAGAAVMGATVATQPSAQVVYDGATDETWEADATGPFGVAWIPDATGSPAQLTVSANNMEKTFADVQLMADALTFVAAEIP